MSGSFQCPVGVTEVGRISVLTARAYALLGVGGQEEANVCVCVIGVGINGTWAMN